MQPDDQLQSLLPALRAGVAAMQLNLSEQQLQQLLHHSAEMLRWNKRLNLTAITVPSQVLTQHILDSLSILPFIQGQRVLDVGTGGGFPGIPLAICRPDVAVTLLDCVAKKCYFLRHICHKLQLQNTQVVPERVDDFSPEQCFDTIVARAWTSLSAICSKTMRLTAAGGRIVSMKGAVPQAEIEALGFPAQAHAVTVPGLVQQRHMIIIQRDNIKGT